ncbi:DUF1648 domain-containing protein [Tumidithrix elongata RA019]|uniref:DUF1648 domain-containing protein n=1 Tax=Tumidithrix elongata BACA0141 TaxID=2716417 RepID=A0AAW9PZF9_9CYAN|nr:DUF1648 domain-containing protein [Tumidithrix elongata RA019]
MKFPFYGILALVAFAIAQVIYYFPLLPETVASHFNNAGQANGASPKIAYFGLYFLVVAIVLGISLGIPRLLDRLPISIINLSNKEYWLSEDNRFGSIAYLKQSFGWFGVMTLLLVIVAFQLTFLANLDPAKSFSSFWLFLSLGAYLISVVIWIVALYRRFHKPPA